MRQAILGYYYFWSSSLFFLARGIRLGRMGLDTHHTSAEREREREREKERKKEKEKERELRPMCVGGVMKLC